MWKPWQRQKSIGKISLDAISRMVAMPTVEERKKKNLKVLLTPYNCYVSIYANLC